MEFSPRRRAAASVAVPLLAVLFTGCALAPPSSLNPAGVTPISRDAAKPVEAELLYHLLAGEVAGQRNRLAEAVDHYAAAARLSDDPRVAERAVRISVYAARTGPGLEAARRWSELAPADPEAAQARAALAVRAGRADEAAGALAHLLTLVEDPARGYEQVGSLLAREAEEDVALAAMEVLVARAPRTPEAHFTLARLAAQAGRAEPALQAVAEALTLRPAWPEALVLRARLLAEAGRVDAAVADLAAAVAGNPDDTELRMAYARLLVEQGRLEEADTQFGVLAEREPDNPAVIYSLGLLALEAERLDDARDYFQRLLDLEERVQVARYYLGRIAEEHARPAAALDWYRQVEEGEYWLDAQARLSRLLAANEGLAAARDYLQAQRAARPDAAVRLILMEGALLVDADRYPQAMTLYTDALNQSPGHVDLLYARALVAERLDRLEMAEDDLRRILQKDPDNVHALNALGYTLADRTERLQEALGYLERALSMAPRDPAVIDSMGWVQYRLGNYAAAREHLEQAYELSRDSEIGAHLGAALWRLGERERARAVWAESRARDPDNPVLLRILREFQP